MLVLSIISVSLYLLPAIVHSTHGLDYSDLEAMDVDCPRFDRCRSYKNDLNYLERSCECDSECNTYNDCCIDAGSRNSKSQSSPENRMICMHCGNQSHSGVYAIASCSDDWTGSQEIREKCEGPDDFTYPANAAPLGSSETKVTYRNRYCAQCNNEMLPLTYYEIALICEGLEHFSQDDIIENLTYNSDLDTWGFYRLDESSNQRTFVGCDVTFEVPDNLKNSVRFCRSNVISTCSPTWTRRSVKMACQKYMAVVFEGPIAYRNPHCAICNHRKLDDLSCPNILINQADTELFSLPIILNPQFTRNRKGKSCAPNEIYDPSFKMCKSPKCVIPGTIERNGRCVIA